MIRRYRKIKGDMPLLAAEDRGQYQIMKNEVYDRRHICPLSSSVFRYLPLSPQIIQYCHISLSPYLHISQKRNYYYLHLSPFIYK